MKESVDLLVTGACELVTLAGGTSGPRCGPALEDLGSIEGGAVAIRAGRVVRAGPQPEILGGFEGHVRVDAGGRLVTPGFVDPHTHPAFARTREGEFEMRARGRTYLEIAEAGGGIRASVRALRATTRAELVGAMRIWLDRFLRHGTTTLEAKSGYGLRTEDEIKSLEAIRECDATHPLDLLATFLGAHEIPDEYRDDREGYLRLLVEEMIPEVSRRGLARFCDVFCEKGVYTIEETRRILEAARRHGLRGRIHADEFVDSGGARLAGETGCLSADHLMAVSEEGIAAMGRGGVVPILLPGTTFFLGSSRYAPARKLIEAGLPVALATDFNPGSSMICSMPFILTLACIYLHMSPAEALAAATVNPAHSLGIGGEVGCLDPGTKADLVVFDVPNHRSLPYHAAGDVVTMVIKGGRVVYGGP